MAYSALCTQCLIYVSFMYHLCIMYVSSHTARHMHSAFDLYILPWFTALIYTHCLHLSVQRSARLDLCIIYVSSMFHLCVTDVSCYTARYMHSALIYTYCLDTLCLDLHVLPWRIAQSAWIYTYYLDSCIIYVSSMRHLCVIYVSSMCHLCIMLYSALYTQCVALYTLPWRTVPDLYILYGSRHHPHGHTVPDLYILSTYCLDPCASCLDPYILPSSMHRARCITPHRQIPNLFYFHTLHDGACVCVRACA